METFREMIKKKWDSPAPGDAKKDQKQKQVIVPPKYEKLIFTLRQRGLKIGNLQTKTGAVKVVFGDYPDINTALKGFNYKILGSVKIDGVSYKFIGRDIKPTKKRERTKLPGILTLSMVCRNCKRPTMVVLNIMKEKKCFTCGGTNLIKRHNVKITKDNTKVQKEQGRCIRSILGTNRSKGK